MFVARKLGWLDRAKVQLIETDNPTQSMTLMRNGEVHGAALTLEEAIFLQRDGLELTIPCVFNISAGADKILAQPSIRNVPELKYKKIGVETGSMGEIFLLQILKKHNMNLSDVNIVHVPVNAHVQAWRNDQLDGIVTYGSSAETLTSLDANVLADSAILPNQVFDILCLNESALPDQQDHLKHLLSGHFRALQHFQDFPYDSTARMAERLKTPPDDVLHLFREIVLLSIEENEDILSGDPAPLETHITALSHLIDKMGGETASPITPITLSPDHLPSRQDP